MDFSDTTADFVELALSTPAAWSVELFAARSSAIESCAWEWWVTRPIRRHRICVSTSKKIPNQERRRRLERHPGLPGVSAVSSRLVTLWEREAKLSTT